MYQQCGLTLLELLIVIAVVAITVTMGAPGIISAFQSQYVKGASENTYMLFGYARSTAISNGADMTLDIVDGTNWCIGVSDAGACDCSVVNSCLVDGVERVERAADYPNVQMSNVTFVGSQSVIDGQRGMAVGNAGSLEFTRNNDNLRVVLSNLARPRICLVGGDVRGYPAC
ncbi:GspH/FimT family pseudopilin [Aliiglaciecola sp. CAU 1673]|uniref:GspH/FimT family pseudopilin n=1 Tax=Aliiglaciecola sp. CAU 1673 TaxID=3032595 RepID=UPI0023DAD4D3|nr:GspH/FimT family pseudopilin [Aliiglaciecola sp. CAU 1673]MDF2178219.1 GspH/FimT family pseudopilin [Aliiglaciecola sp. CAU 1673]